MLYSVNRHNSLHTLTNFPLNSKRPSFRIRCDQVNDAWARDNGEKKVTIHIKAEQTYT